MSRKIPIKWVTRNINELQKHAEKKDLHPKRVWNKIEWKKEQNATRKGESPFGTWVTGLMTSACFINLYYLNKK